MSTPGDTQRRAVRGFAGLSTLVSDVDAVIEQAAKARRANPPPQAKPTVSEAEEAVIVADRRPTATPSTDQSSSGKWLIGVCVVFGAFWLMAQLGDERSAASNRSIAPTSAPSPETAAPQPTPASNAAPVRPTETKPPVGTNNILSVSQIRYCVSEDIRLGAANKALDNYSEPDVDRFNMMVDDFNSRCGEYRYRSGTLERAKSDIEPWRPVLEEEGRNRFMGGQRGAAVQPDPKLRVWQEQLNALGYDAGVADGIMGEKTRAAIAAFQADMQSRSDDSEQ